MSLKITWKLARKACCFDPSSIIRLQLICNVLHKTDFNSFLIFLNKNLEMVEYVRIFCTPKFFLREYWVSRSMVGRGFNPQFSSFRVVVQNPFFIASNEFAEID